MFGIIIPPLQMIKGDVQNMSLIVLEIISG